MAMTGSGAMGTHASRGVKPFCLTMAALLVTLPVSAPAVAQDEPARAETIRERARPLFDPIGLPARPWRFFPSLSTELQLDDNIFADDEIVRADIAFVVEPSVSVREELEGIEVRAEAFGRFTQYVDNRSESNEEFGFDASVDYEIDSSLQVGAAAGFQRETVSRSDPEDADLDEPLQRNLFEADLSADYTLNRVSFTLTGEVRLEDFLPEEEDDEDRQRYSGIARVSYEVSPKVDAFIEGQFSALRFTSRESDDNEANTFTALTGSAFDFNGIVFGEVGVGVFHQDFLDPAEGDFTGLALNAGIDWNVTALTGLRASVIRRDEATRVGGATSRVRTELRVGATHELLRNLLIDVDGSYRIDEFEGIDRTDETFRAAAGIEYIVNRMLATFARYEFTTRTSDDPESEFDRNLAIIGVSARL